MSAPADPRPGQVFRAEPDDGTRFTFGPDPAYEPGADPTPWRVDTPDGAEIYVAADHLPAGLVPVGGEAAPDAAVAALAEARELVVKLRDEAARLPVAELRQLAADALAEIDKASARLGDSGAKGLDALVADGRLDPGAAAELRKLLGRDTH